MKIHLSKTLKNGYNSLACTNNSFVKGAVVSFEKFEQSNNKCQRCLNSYTYKKLSAQK